ncbi:NAD(P)H-binding protein [Amaricoccus macauensis]|uniref:NAD(P)H-binding protein n=1 Tax=Amaricoccus macauensis TaxID=57001 RepID=UPI003C7D71D7
MTIAVTAATGHLGAEIVRKLIAMPEAGPVIGLARTPKKAEGLGIEIRPGDYTRPDDLKASLAGVYTVLLVSGMDAPENRIGQHRNVIEAARAAGVKKIVYTSIQGPEAGTRFSPVVQSNRQTEADIRASGLDWSIGRNGIYIEPDIEYIESYRAAGEIANCAGAGKCGYTTRSELAHAYARLLTRADHDGRTVDLNGRPITQAELAVHMNDTFGTALRYRELTAEEFAEDRARELGLFLGGVIAGIYEGIQRGDYDRPGDYEAVAGRPHLSWEDYFAILKG